MRQPVNNPLQTLLASAVRFVVICAVSILAANVPAPAEVNRVVILKIDGLPEGLLERYALPGAGTRDRPEQSDTLWPGLNGRPLAGQFSSRPAAASYPSRPSPSLSQQSPSLPWISEIFGKEGTWIDNFYVRGLSLSAPSWSLLDTGRHLEIRGNAEYDRYTLRVFDYLNVFPFYLGYAMQRHADMPGVELLEERSTPLLIDRFSETERYQGFQLLQRGVRWSTLKSSLTGKFTSRPLKDIFDEWQTGFSMSTSVNDQMERELLTKLNDPRVKYLDYFSGEFDHVAHLTSDRLAQLRTLKAIDALVGHVASEIVLSPMADTTALVLVSDHGMNSSESIYSQGYNLVDWFGSAAGGSHHVMTNRHPMTEFKLKGLDPLVSQVITASPDSLYLANQSTQYPTVALDLDGNERASVELRNSRLNVLHILLEQLIRTRLQGPVRSAAIDAFFSVLEHERPTWQHNLNELQEELNALREQIAELQRVVQAQSRDWSKQDREAGLDKAALRAVDRLETWKAEQRMYSEYIAAMSRLLALNPSDFDPGKFKIEDVIPRRSLGEPNSIRDLQHYAAGPAPGGLVLAPDGSLDMEKSFRTINYFSALGAIAVRNNVQKAVSPRPIDFIAVPVSRDQLARSLTLQNTSLGDNAGDTASFADEGERSLGDGVWLYAGDARQALILTRYDKTGHLEIRYLPVGHLTEDGDGYLRFERLPWAAGFPLEMFEDPNLDASITDSGPGRAAFLAQWHDERTWFRAVHRTKYSNGIIGLVEQMLIANAPPASEPGDRSLSMRYSEHKRALRRPDLQIFAQDHWNFNVRGFNPGGNHGSSLRASTHSVLLVRGGKNTGIPQGLHVTEPYDSLSFVPTILELMGKPESGLAGPVITELFPK